MNRSVDAVSAARPPSHAPLLRAALGFNGLFSGTTGLVMSFAPHVVGGWIGSEQTTILRLLGIGLLGFAALLLYLSFVARRPQPLSLVASLADFGWVAGTVVLAVIAQDALSPRGWLIAAVVAAIVLACGVAQLVGIHRGYRHPTRPGWLTLGFRFPAEAPAPSMWRVVRSVDTIHEHAGSLADAAIVEGSPDQHSLVRECRDARGRCWREALSIDDEGMELRAQFQTGRSGFPFPFREMEGGWDVAPSPGGCEVRVWWDVVPRRPWAACVVMPLSEIMLGPSFRKTIASMRDAAVAESSAAGSETRSER